MLVSDKVKKLRKILDLSQEKLSKLLSSNQARISLIESGKRLPSYRMVEKLNKLVKKHRIRIKFV